MREIISDVKPGMGVTPAVVLINPKFPHNAGGILRTASALGIRQLWLTGDRWKAAVEERGRFPREERMRQYENVDLFSTEYPLDAFDRDVVPVCVEITPTAEPLAFFQHPEKAVYVFGPEDGSVPKWARRLTHRFVILPTGTCLNLSVAAGIVLMHRRLQRQQLGLEPIWPAYATTEEQERRGFLDTDQVLEWV